MVLSVFSVIHILSCTHLLLSGRHLVSGKVFTCEQSLAPVTDQPAASTPSPLTREAFPAPRQITSSTSLSITGIMPSNFGVAPSITGITLSTAATAPTITAIRMNNIPVGPSAPLQPSGSGGPLPTKELACKSEVGERTFTFCVADSCIGTATCEGCRSDFGMMGKVKCMAYNIQNQRNFCQDINGVKFLCAGKCATRTSCSNCQYDNVAKSKAFQPPWGREAILSSAAQQALSPTWMLATLVASNLAYLF